MAMQIIFAITALFIICSAVMVVITKSMVHAALWLVATLFGVAVIFTLLNAEFLALVQVVVYIGAIAIMFIFAVMLTRRDMRDSGPQLNAKKWIALVISAVFFGGLAFILSTWEGFNKTAEAVDTTQLLADLGKQLLQANAYLLPFEVASVLLLAALVGAVYVAANRK
jgi:NADH-quinone oxidoreductase subunit J